MSSTKSDNTEIEQREDTVAEPLSTQDGERESENDKAAEEIANKVIKHAASLSVVKINRKTFLRAELKKHCPDADIELALQTTPSEAGVPAAVLDKIARGAIDFETKKCAGLSFLSGIPGGAALAATAPADLAQYFAHVMRVEQKLAYVYGWQSFLNDNDEVDDETVMQLVLLMGVMLGVGGVAGSISKFAANVAQQSVVKTIQRQALTKTVFYTPMKNVLRVIGVKLTKDVFSKAVGKAVPVIGGAISGGLTYASLKPGAEHLRQYLRSLPVSGVADIPEEKSDSIDLESVANATKGAVSKAAEGAASAGTTLAEAAQGFGRFAAKKSKSAGAFLGSFGKGRKERGAKEQKQAKIKPEDSPSPSSSPSDLPDDSREQE